MQTAPPDPPCRGSLFLPTVLCCALALGSCVPMVVPGGGVTVTVEGDDSPGPRASPLKSLGFLTAAGPVIAWALDAVSVQGPVKGKEPVVAAFELEEDGVLELTLKVSDAASGKKGREAAKREPEVVSFGGRAGAREEKIGELPRKLGSEWRPAELAFAAYRAGTREPIGFEVFGLGVGRKAVGSLVVRQLTFGPREIGAGEDAQISFLLLKDFDKARVDVLRELEADAARTAVRTLETACKLRRNRSCRETWDGTDDDGRRSTGRHQAQVRVWRDRTRSKDWSAVRLDGAWVEVR